MIVCPVCFYAVTPHFLFILGPLNSGVKMLFNRHETKKSVLT